MPWWQIAVLIASAILAFTAIPKKGGDTPQPQKGSVPSIKDGKRIVRVFGTVWIDDPMQLAMKQMGEDPIRSKGGKK